MKHTTSTASDILARRLASGLDTPLSHDISERLRAARVRAVAQRRVSTVQVQANGTLTLGTTQEALRPWTWLASLLPLLALVVGLVTIAGHFTMHAGHGGHPNHCAQAAASVAGLAGGTHVGR